VGNGDMGRERERKGKKEDAIEKDRLPSMALASLQMNQFKCESEPQRIPFPSPYPHRHIFVFVFWALGIWEGKERIIYERSDGQAILLSHACYLLSPFFTLALLSLLLRKEGEHGKG